MNYFKTVLKTRQTRPNMELHLLSSHLTKLRLNYSFCSLRSGILNQSTKNHLIITSEVICLIDPCHSPKESKLAITNLLFCLVLLLCPTPFCL